MAGAIIGPVVGSVVSGLFSDGSSGGGGGGGGGGGSGVSPAQEALANTQTQIAQGMYDRYKSTFIPLENQFIADASAAGTPEMIAAKMGAAHGTGAQTTAAAVKASIDTARARGISLDSPAAFAMTQDANLAGAANDAAAQTAARDAEINRGLTLKQAAIGIGRGMDQTAASGLSAASNALSAGASQFNAAWNRGRTANMDAGYAVAPIARAAGTAATNWAKNGGFGTGGGVVSGATPYNDTNWGGNYSPSTSSWNESAPDYYSYRDGGVIGAARRGIAYADGGVIDDERMILADASPIRRYTPPRAGMDAQAVADMEVRGDRGQPAAQPTSAPSGRTMTQTEFANAGSGPRRLTDAEREAKLREMDRNRPSPGQKKRLADGGVVVGPGGPTDDAVPGQTESGEPIAVSNGEGVVNEKAAADVLGYQLLHVINALGVARRAIEGDAANSPQFMAARRRGIGG